MNKLIKELANQANEDTKLLMIMEYGNFESHLYERFAELVAMKCIDICKNTHQSRMGAEYAAATIKTQFGLK